jgi:hypothetical protein
LDGLPQGRPFRFHRNLACWLSFSAKTSKLRYSQWRGFRRAVRHGLALPASSLISDEILKAEKCRAARTDLAGPALRHGLNEARDGRKGLESGKGRALS